MANIDLKDYKRQLIIRPIQHEDIDEITEMAELGFENPEITFKRKHYESHLRIFPEGQVCIEYDGKIIGSCSSLIVNFDDYPEQHTIDEITDEGYIRNHNPDGANLYGTDVVVHPDYRHMKIGRRLYEARRRICRELNLKSIIFGGRIPNYHQYAKDMTAEEYVQQVIQKKIYDPVVTFQLMNGFVFKQILPNYLPEDKASLKYATLMEWENPDYCPENSSLDRMSKPVRLAAIQFRFKEIDHFEELAAQCEYYVDAASRVRADFVLFPEFLTMPLLSFLEETVPSLQVRKLTTFTEAYIHLFSELSIKYSINILAGSHFLNENGAILNSAFLFERNGNIERQDRLHITPDEKKWWGLVPGDELKVFDTDCGKISILTSYDILFPELSRKAAEKGAQILFMPFSATDRQGYLRIRYCAQARVVENQMFAAIAGSVGHLSHVLHTNSQHAGSGVFSPVDYSFPEHGVVAECVPGIETIVIGDVDLEALRRNRELGTVIPFKDRRKMNRIK